MPTGYTARVTDETTLADFALSCARAFGALIELRDEPMDAPIPDVFEVSQYHRESLARAEAKLRKLETTTPEKADALLRSEYEAALKHYEKSAAENRAQRAMYERLLAKVQVWVAPTESHVGLKDFMIQQLQTTIEHDCYEPTPPKLQTAKEWLAESLKSARWSVDYHRKGWADDQARAAERTAWIRDLRKSLGM